MDTLESGQVLHPGGYILSENGRTLLVLQRDGNLVVYAADSGHPLWSSRTAGKTVDMAVMQSDGNLVLERSDGLPIWATATQGNGGAYLHAQDDGNVVMLSPGGRVLWNSETYGFNTTDSVRASKSLFDFFGSVESLGGVGTSWAFPITDITSDPRFVAAAATAVAFAVSGPGGAAAAGAAFAAVAGAAVATGGAIQTGKHPDPAIMIRAGEQVADAGGFTIDLPTAQDIGMPTLGDIGGGLQAVPFVDVKALVLTGQAKILDDAGNLLGGNPNAPVEITFSKAEAPYKMSNLYGNPAVQSWVESWGMPANAVSGASVVEARYGSEEEAPAPAGGTSMGVKVVLFLIGATAFTFWASRKG